MSKKRYSQLISRRPKADRGAARAKNRLFDHRPLLEQNVLIRRATARIALAIRLL
jgi:hypothetical protein